MSTTLIVLLALCTQPSAQEAPLPPPAPQAAPTASTPTDGLTQLATDLTAAEDLLASGDRDGALRAVAAVIPELGGLDVTPETGDDIADLFWRVGQLTRRLNQLPVTRVALQWVVDWRERTLEPHDRLLFAARAELAEVLAALGDWPAVVDQQRLVVEHLAATVDADDPDLVLTRRMLARACASAGDPRGALEQHDAVYASLRRTRPDDDPELQAARRELATLRYQLGDYEGALALFEQVVAHFRDEVRAGRRAADDIDLVLASANLAEVLRRRGHYAQALALQEEVVASLGRSLPEDDVRLHQARGHLASTLLMIGQVERPLSIAREMLAAFEAQLAPEHELVVWARRELARALRAHGDARQALALDEQAYERLVAELPPDHADVQSALLNLVWSSVELGLLEDIVEHGTAWARSARRAVRPWGLAPRALGRLANRFHIDAGMLLTLGRGGGALPPLPALDGEALLLIEVLRGLETRSARRARQLWSQARQDSAGAALLADLRAASARVLEEASRPLEPGEARETSLRERNARLTDAVAARERLQLRLLETTGDRGDEPDPTLERLAAALPEHTAAVSWVAYREAHTPGLQALDDDRRVAAFVLTPAGRLSRVELGSQRRIASLVDDFAADLAPQTTRGRPLTPGRPLDDPGLAHEGDHGSAGIQARGAALRAALLDPLEALLGDDVHALHVSLDSWLQTVPLEALPTDTGVPYGERRRVRRHVSLLELLGERPEPAEHATDRPAVLLTLGDVRYGESWSPRDAAEDPGLRWAPPGGFAALPGTAREIDGIAELFLAEHPDGRVHRLRGDAAHKRALLELAPGARTIHLATHGYLVDEPDTGISPAWAVGGFEGLGVAELSPLVLTGLALSGANGSAGSADLAALLTAEELLALDLSGCELVTLSACDTARGVQRESQGFASLQAALLGGGARCVVTSLWSVGDAATAELMLAFYEGLWRDGLEVREALWQAQSRLRARGAPLADWAGWIVMGR